MESLPKCSFINLENAKFCRAVKSFSSLIDDSIKINIIPNSGT